MACSGGCGGKKRIGNVGARIFDPTREPMPKRTDKNMYWLAGDDPETESQYHGAFQGSTVLLVGYQTEHERLYRYSQRAEAMQFAAEHKVGMWRVSSVVFTHARMVALLGA